MTMVGLLDVVSNFENLKAEVLDVISKVDPALTQISLQGLESNPSDWTASSGRIEQLAEQDETLYSHINPAIEGTAIAALIKKYNCFRSRIMLMPSRHCYSVHHDPTLRIHIPIVTNSQAWMLWPFHNECHRMQVGKIYLTDTTKPHTFMNGDTSVRIHLVLGTTQSFLA